MYSASGARGTGQNVVKHTHTHRHGRVAGGHYEFNILVLNYYGLREVWGERAREIIVRMVSRYCLSLNKQWQGGVEKLLVKYNTYSVRHC